MKLENRASILALLLLLSPGVACPAGKVADPSAASKIRTILIDGHAGGKEFDGIGALSAGASSRLLIDYPEPERSQILDYLFKPGYGASLQILKVEIGGDSNSTSGAEPSHMRTPDDLSGVRGYEWWLMKEAKARNPDIKLWGLAWCVPGWFEGGYWSDDNIRYHLAWLRLARDQGLKIDYVGGWNERGFNVEWYKKWKKALRAEFPEVQIVGPDDITNPWDIIEVLAADPDFYDAIDIVGVHDPCLQRSAYRHCPSPQAARELGKKLWDSEQSSQGHDLGAGPLARAMNRQYIEGGMTANIVWSLISAWYSSLPLADTGLMLADQPWSGHYRVGKSIWVHAHTAQFTRIGWRYIDDACGYFSQGASYVTLKSADNRDVTVVVESLDAVAEETVRFELNGRFLTSPIQVWSTDLKSDDPSEHFVLEETIERPEGGAFSVTFKPGHVYTLSTVKGHKGTAAPRMGPSVVMELPFKEDFESSGGPGRLARYFSDLEGAFEISASRGGRSGYSLRQAVRIRPVGWNSNLLPPTTVMGDPRWWGDYAVSTDAYLEEAGHVEILGRSSGQRGTKVAGYHFRIGSDGGWKLYSQEFGRDDKTLASGPDTIGVEKWHRIGLRFKGSRIEVQLDGKTLRSVDDGSHRSGQVGLATGQWQTASFDNFEVVPTGPSPVLIPHSEVTVVATSEHGENHRGWDYKATNAIDDRPETAWSSEWEPRAPMPQSITLDLGRVREVRGLLCQPKVDAAGNGHITGYKVSLSEDGVAFREVADGSWEATSSTKVVSWPRKNARFVRLEAVSTSGGAARVGELFVSATEIEH